jgi:hypothetical protein
MVLEFLEACSSRLDLFAASHRGKHYTKQPPRKVILHLETLKQAVEATKPQGCLSFYNLGLFKLPCGEHAQFSLHIGYSLL